MTESGEVLIRMALHLEQVAASVRDLVLARVADRGVLDALSSALEAVREDVTKLRRARDLDDAIAAASPRPTLLPVVTPTHGSAPVELADVRVGDAASMLRRAWPYLATVAAAFLGLWHFVEKVLLSHRP